MCLDHFPWNAPGKSKTSPSWKFWKILSLQRSFFFIIGKNKISKSKLIETHRVRQMTTFALSRLHILFTFFLTWCNSISFHPIYKLFSDYCRPIWGLHGLSIENVNLSTLSFLFLEKLKFFTFLIFRKWNVTKLLISLSTFVRPHCRLQ